MPRARLACIFYLCVAVVAPTGSAQNRARGSTADAGTSSHGASDASHSSTNSGPPAEGQNASTPPEDLLGHTLQVDERFESLLETGCTYEVTVRGTVSPVRDNRNANATTQRLRPDLRVAATVRCPQSTESHIQERRVYSTGVTRDELERLVELNGTVHRMQNSGRCLYVPAVSFTTTGFVSPQVDYLCPRSTSRTRSTR